MTEVLDIVFLKMVQERDWKGLIIYFGMGLLFVIFLLVVFKILGAW